MQTQHKLLSNDNFNYVLIRITYCNIVFFFNKHRSMSNSYYITVAEIEHNEIQLASLIITHSITGADSSEGG